MSERLTSGGQRCGEVSQDDWTFQRSEVIIICLDAFSDQETKTDYFPLKEKYPIGVGIPFMSIFEQMS